MYNKDRWRGNLIPVRTNAAIALNNRALGNRGWNWSHCPLHHLVDRAIDHLPTENEKFLLPARTRTTFITAFSNDNSLLASCHGDHNTHILDVKTKKVVKSLSGHERSPWCVTFHPKTNEIIATGSLNGEVRVWDLRGEGSETWTLEHSDEDQIAIASLSFHPYDHVLAIAGGNEIYFWDWRLPRPFASVKTNTKEERVRLVRFDPWGHHILTGVGSIEEDDLEPDYVPPSSSTSLPWAQSFEPIRWEERRRQREGTTAGNMRREISETHQRILHARVSVNEEIRQQYSRLQRLRQERHLLEMRLRELQASANEVRNSTSTLPDVEAPAVNNHPGEDPRRDAAAFRPYASSIANSERLSILDEHVRDIETRLLHDLPSQPLPPSSVALAIGDDTVQGNPIEISHATNISPPQWTASSSNTQVNHARSFHERMQSLLARQNAPIDPPGFRSSGVSRAYSRLRTLRDRVVSIRQRRSRQSSNQRIPQNNGTLNPAYSQPRIAPYVIFPGYPVPVEPPPIPAPLSLWLPPIPPEQPVQVTPYGNLNREATRLNNDYADFFGPLVTDRELNSSNRNILAVITPPSGNTESATRHSDYAENLSRPDGWPAHGSANSNVGVFAELVPRSHPPADVQTTIPPPRTAVDIDNDPMWSSGLAQPLRNIEPVVSIAESNFPFSMPSSLRRQSTNSRRSRISLTLNETSDHSAYLRTSVIRSTPANSTLGGSFHPSSSQSSQNRRLITGEMVPATSSGNSNTTDSQDTLPLTMTRTRPLHANPSTVASQGQTTQPSSSTTSNPTGSSSSLAAAHSLSDAVNSLIEATDTLNEAADNLLHDAAVSASNLMEDSDSSSSGSPSDSQAAQQRSSSVRTRQLTEPSHSRLLSGRRHSRRPNLIDPERERARFRRANRRAARRQRRSRHAPRQPPTHVYNQAYSIGPRRVSARNMRGWSSLRRNSINRIISDVYAENQGHRSIFLDLGRMLYRLQYWDFSKLQLPEICRKNIIVESCKIYNDASVDVSRDGRVIAAFVPSTEVDIMSSAPSNVMEVAVFSLEAKTFGQILFRRECEHNLVCLSISPLSNRISVGFKYRHCVIGELRSTKYLMGHVFAMSGEEEMPIVHRIFHPAERNSRVVSINTISWSPEAGGGLVYGTNNGEVRKVSLRPAGELPTKTEMSPRL